MPNYTIAIQNLSGSAKSYMVFADPPLVSVNGQTPLVSAGAWATFPNIGKQSFDSFTVPVQYHVDWQTPQTSPAAAGQVGSGSYAPVDPGQSVAFGVAVPVATPSSGVTAMGSDPAGSDASVPLGSFGD